MTALQRRFSTEYIDHEDRIRITGEVKNGPPQVIWLTRRLLDRLIPHLSLWLEKRQGDLPRGDLLMSFAQQKAQRGVVSQVAVLARADSLNWLVQEVDISTGLEQLKLTFKNSDGNAAGVEFSMRALHQWLAILRQGYVAGQWPMTAWPAWMNASDGGFAHSGPMVVWH